MDKEHKRKPGKGLGQSLERASRVVTDWAGSSWAFGLSVLVIVVWLVSGPIFRFSDTWQLVINTGTTIVTFLMVFLIQRSQNKDSLAIQLKLNEIVASQKGASNRLIAVEDLSEEELHTLHRHYAKLAAMSAKEEDIGSSHSIEEAKMRHAIKEKVKARESSAGDAAPEPLRGRAEAQAASESSSS